MAKQESRLTDMATETAGVWRKECGRRTIVIGLTFQPVLVSHQSNGGKDTYFIAFYKLGGWKEVERWSD